MKKIENTHNQFSYSSLKPITLSVAILSVGFTVFNYFLLEGEEKYLIMGLTAFSALVFSILRYVLRIPKTLYKYTTALTVLTVGVPYFIVFTHMWVFKDPLQTSLILLLHVTASVIIMNRAILIGLISGTTLIWLGIAFHFGFTAQWMHFVFSLAPTIMLAIIANTLIYLNFKSIQKSRVKAKLKNEELEEAKAKLEMQSEELKETIEELELAKNEVERASKSKTQFLSALSHELRTPLNAVIGLSKMLFKNNPRPDQIDDLETLQFSADSLLSLINDLLDFSKMKTGKVRLEEVEFDIEELLNKMIKSFENRANEKGLKLHCELDNLSTTNLVGDPNRLIQVMNNLIANAVKFTDEGEVVVQCFETTPDENDLRLKFEVRDTGVGIPKDKQDAIFEAFDQVHLDSGRRYGGTGLGLTITQKLVELMGGEINVESELGKGSVFSFTLPFKNSSKNEHIDKSEIEIPKQKSLTEHKSKEISLPKGFKVLLVDDNDLNVRVLSKMLKNQGIQHEIVMDGSSACQLIQNKQYSLVLMDLQMPIMNGYEAAREIRSMNDEYFKEIPIIALTASSVLEVEDDIKEVGMNDCISKPVESEELFQKMQKVLALQKAV